MAIYDFDIAMVNVSIVVAQSITVDRKRGNIRFYMTKTLYATIKDEKHHSVTLELLERKWGICLGNSKETLIAKNSVLYSFSPTTPN